jgi:hypothetical protein
MEKITGYVYSVETKKVIAEITGETRQIEKYVDENYDSETCGLTFSPAFGFSDGLIDVVDNDKEFIEL